MDEDLREQLKLIYSYAAPIVLASESISRLLTGDDKRAERDEVTAKEWWKVMATTNALLAHCTLVGDKEETKKLLSVVLTNMRNLYRLFGLEMKDKKRFAKAHKAVTKEEWSDTVHYGHVLRGQAEIWINLLNFQTLTTLAELDELRNPQKNGEILRASLGGSNTTFRVAPDGKVWLRLRGEDVQLTTVYELRTLKENGGIRHEAFDETSVTFRVDRDDKIWIRARSWQLLTTLAELAKLRGPRKNVMHSFLGGRGTPFRVEEDGKIWIRLRGEDQKLTTLDELQKLKENGGTLILFFHGESATFRVDADDKIWIRLRSDDQILTTLAEMTAIPARLGSQKESGGGVLRAFFGDMSATFRVDKHGKVGIRLGNSGELATKLDELRNLKDHGGIRREACGNMSATIRVDKDGNISIGMLSTLGSLLILKNDGGILCGSYGDMRKNFGPSNARNIFANLVYELVATTENDWKLAMEEASWHNQPWTLT